MNYSKYLPTLRSKYAPHRSHATVAAAAATVAVSRVQWRRFATGCCFSPVINHSTLGRRRRGRSGGGGASAHDGALAHNSRFATTKAAGANA